MYIVVEGHDLAGKSTQIKKIEQMMMQLGKQVITVTEPYMGHYTGQAIREFMAAKHTNSNELYELYKRNRNYLYNSVIRPALEQGMVVVSDRNFISSMVYQENIGMLNVLKDNPNNIPNIVFHIQTSHETYLERLKHKKGLEVIEKELADPVKFKELSRRYKEAISATQRITNCTVFNIRGD